MISWLARLILKLWGFSVKGDPANHIDKKVYVVIPHTSNWDFPLGILVRSAHHIDVGFVAKDSLFKPPFGFLFRWLGGYPVNRTASSNYVEKVVKIYENHSRMAIAIAPEGTRKKVEKLRSGFYHIARLARIPMILTRFDFGRKEVVFSDPVMVSDDQEEDFQQMYRFFEGVIGKIPENGFTIDQ